MPSLDAQVAEPALPECPDCGRGLRDFGFLKGEGRFVWTVRVLRCLRHGNYFLSRNGPNKAGQFTGPGRLFRQPS